MTVHGDREMWRTTRFACVMISCCSGAELQIKQRDGSQDVVLRELYPSKSDLYERARMLEAEYRASDG